MGDLETLVPHPVEVEAGGKTIAITPIRVKELPAFMRAVESLFGAAASGADIAALLALNTDAVIEAAAIGARQPRSFIDSLDLDELIDVAAAVLEVNADFFARRVAPRLAATSKTLEALVDGLSSMPASAPPDSEAASI